MGCDIKDIFTIYCVNFKFTKQYIVCKFLGHSPHFYKIIIIKRCKFWYSYLKIKNFLIL